MSELANLASPLNELGSPSADVRYCWQAPDGSIALSMAGPVWESIKQHVMEAFRALPRRGLEVGGILLGRVARRKPLEISIQSFQPVPCEHRFGPSFILSDVDRQQLEQMLAQSQPEWSVVGYYRSFTGRDIGLDAIDRELLQQHFSAPEHIVLAIKPVSASRCVAWCFARQDGHVPSTPTGSPSPFVEGPGSSPAEAVHAPAVQQEGGGNGERPISFEGRSPSADEAMEGNSEPGGVAVVAEPAPAPGSPSLALLSLPPQREREPERATPLRMLPWALALVAGLAGFAVYHRSAAPSNTQPLLHVGLAAQRTAGGVEVTWDGSVVAQQKATGGLLTINDGDSARHIELDAAAVARGRLTYEASGDNLVVRLSIFGPGTYSATESFRVARAVSSPPPPVDAPERAGTVPEKPEVFAQPVQPPAARPENTPPPAPPRWRTPAEPHVAAVAIHEVRPGISDAVQARLRNAVTVAVSVQIDVAGRVTGAKSEDRGDGVYRYLAQRAEYAARFWRFRAARDRRGNPVPSTKTLFFVFRS